MTKSTTPTKASGLSEEQFKKLIAFISALVATLAALIAFMQSDASARDDRANRDTKRYATEALGRQVSGDARVNYDYNKAYQNWYELDLLATSASARGDDAAAQRYLTLRDQTTTLSPLLAAPYFNSDTGEVDITRYEAEVYLVDITILTEKFVAASGVKDAWDSKANTYIIHLTLLAVALFLLALSITLSGPTTRWIFAGVGMAVTVWAAGWAAATYLQPVSDLRDTSGAIEAYAKGQGLAYQSRWDEALTAYNQALTAAPDYATALAGRAEAHSAKGDYAAAAADYEKARAAGDASANLAGELAYVYHLLGRFDDAQAMNRTALQATPDELWIQFDLALSLLAAGKIDEAKAEYTKGMTTAATQVAAAKAANEEPPSFLWWAIDDAAAGLDDLVLLIDTGEGPPAQESIVNPVAVREVALDITHQLKSQAVALEYTGQPPQGTLSAQISPFQFAQAITDENGEVLDYEPATEFEFGVDEVLVLFDYAGLRDGQEVLFKVYINGDEDPSWRIVAPWDLGAEGSAQKPLSLAYSDVFVLGAGEYVVEMYVDSHLAQRGTFVVLDEE